MSTYLVVDASGLVTNLIIWDGVTEYAPPEDATLIEQPEGVGVGWQSDGAGGWIAPAEPDECP